MKTILIRLLTFVVGILVVSHLFPGVSVEGAGPVIIAALCFGVLGIVVVFFKRVLRVLSLPFSLALGLFTLLINGAILWGAGAVVKGFYVNGFVTALGAALVISLLGIVTKRLVG